MPPAPIRELRDLTRARTMLTRERGREIQWLEKVLEDAGIKLSSVASDISSVSGRLMLQALVEGQRDPAALADLAKRRLRAKIPALTEALTGRFSEHHAFLTRMYLEVIVAETGGDMSTFPTAAHLASWAGTCPGSNESAGRIKSTATRPGNAYLKAALGASALSIVNSHGTYLAAKYRRIAARRGPKKAMVAVEHALLTAVWSMAHTGALYDDPGADYYTRRDPERARRNAVNQLQRLGYEVTLTPTAASA